MQIVRTDAYEITIIGNIKTTDDYLAIRQLVTDIIDGGATALTVRIRESLSMPSSVIGFFVKVANRDKIALTMLIQDLRLVELLEELGLANMFGARQQD